MPQLLKLENKSPENLAKWTNHQNDCATAQSLNRSLCKMILYQTKGGGKIKNFYGS